MAARVARAETVGSLLRPAYVLQARRDKEAGASTRPTTASAALAVRFQLGRRRQPLSAAEQEAKLRLVVDAARKVWT